MTKLYTFLDENESIICQVRADQVDHAIKRANAHVPLDHKNYITWKTDFYSESLESLNN